MEIFNVIEGAKILAVAVRTIVMFIFVFSMLRLLGKKHLAHLTYMDLILVIALGSAVGDVMIYDESTSQLLASLVAVGVVGLLIKILSEMAYRSPRLSRIITGSARLIVVDGKIVEENLAKEDLNEEELNALLRERGVMSLGDIKRAYIEIDGEISLVFRKRHDTRRARKAL